MCGLRKRIRVLSFFGFLGLVLGGIHEFLARGGWQLNGGIAFGLGEGRVLAYLSFLVFLVLFFFAIRVNSFVMFFSLTGAGVMLIDRWRFGGVRDYWCWGSWCNNLPDWVLVLGLFVFFLAYCFGSREEK